MNIAENYDLTSEQSNPWNLGGSGDYQKEIQDAMESRQAAQDHISNEIPFNSERMTKHMEEELKQRVEAEVKKILEDRDAKAQQQKLE